MNPRETVTGRAGDAAANRNEGTTLANALNLMPAIDDPCSFERLRFALLLLRGGSAGVAGGVLKPELHK